MKYSLITLLFCFGFFFCIYGQDQSPEEIFEDGDFFFARGDYSEAAYLYRQVLNAEPGNANIKYKLAMAYLNVPGEESSSIPYFLEASKEITLRYRKNRYEEKRAPYHTWFYLGTAYRINNQLEEALESYQQFKSLKDFEKRYNARVTDEEIKAVERAKIIQDAPLDLYKTCFEEPLNSKAKEYNAIISANEQVMVWMNSQKFYEAIMMSIKQDGKWTDPVNITPQVGSDGEMFPTGLSKDGSELLLVRRGEFDSDIYYSKYNGKLWSKAEPIEGELNSNFTEDHASFSPDGNKIIFSSDQRGSKGGLDIFYSEKNNDGSWGEPVNLGSNINTEFDETSAYFSPDMSKLVFSSRGHYNMGGYDIFFSNLLEDGFFSDAVNMGYPVNTTNDNLYFCPVKDGLSGIYVLSNEDERSDDIWYLEIIPFAETMAKSLTRLSDQDFSIQLSNKGNAEVILLKYNSINDKITINSSTGQNYGVVYSREGNDK